MARTRQLTALQAKFARHYAQSHNGADAARKAGYSPRTARIAGSRLLARPHVRSEVARLCLAHPASAARVPTHAKEEVNVISAEVDDFDSAATAARILEEMSETIAEQLARHWLVSTLIRNIKMGMTEIPVRQTRVRTRRKRADGSVYYETTVIEVYERDAAAVVASAKLLLEECDSREKAAEAIKDHADKPKGKTLGARLAEQYLGGLRGAHRDEAEEHDLLDGDRADDLPDFPDEPDEDSDA
jgi:phage terminase small subunit